MIFEVDLLPSLLVAILILFIGFFLSAKIPFLHNYNIPVPVIGGIVFALCIAVLHNYFKMDITFDQGLKDPMMLAFFATVGLSADFKRLRKGGANLLLFLLVVSGFLLVQNLVGALVAYSMDLHPAIGLLSGSVTLSGGHGTGAAYAERFSSIQNIQGAMEIALASATFGLIIGGLIGGPVSQRLIKRHQLQAQELNTSPVETIAVSNREQITLRTFLELLFIIILCLISGNLIYMWLEGSAFTLPAFIWALFAGVLIRNLCEITGLYRVHLHTLDILGTLSLSLFLAMAFMSLQLWQLLDLAGPLLLILTAQTVAIVLYAMYVTYPVMGKNYDAAVMAGGHCGFGMGATPTAVANIEAVTLRYGPSPQAFLVIPVVGAFFIDLTNALVIQGFLTLPMHQF
jgi:ESS family glutamate:Na+ symporter